MSDLTETTRNLDLFCRCPGISTGQTMSNTGLQFVIYSRKHLCWKWLKWFKSMKSAYFYVGIRFTILTICLHAVNSSLFKWKKGIKIKNNNINNKTNNRQIKTKAEEPQKMTESLQILKCPMMVVSWIV